MSSSQKGPGGMSRKYQDTPPLGSIPFRENTIKILGPSPFRATYQIHRSRPKSGASSGPPLSGAGK